MAFGKRSLQPNGGWAWILGAPMMCLRSTRTAFVASRESLYDDHQSPKVGCRGQGPSSSIGVEEMHPDTNLALLGNVLAIRRLVDERGLSSKVAEAA